VEGNGVKGDKERNEATRELKKKTGGEYLKKRQPSLSICHENEWERMMGGAQKQSFDPSHDRRRGRKANTT
jgi:hypothetical protein